MVREAFAAGGCRLVGSAHCDRRDVGLRKSRVKFREIVNEDGSGDNLPETVQSL
jgi:hypothetical protein